MDALDDFGLLLVDDHPLFRDGLVMALQSRAPGLRVQAVSSAEEADQLLSDESQVFDLVLLDYRLQGTDGLRCALSLRLRHCNASFGLMSGIDDASLPARVRDAGLVAYLPKALEVDALIESLQLLATGETVFCESIEASALQDANTQQYGLTARQWSVLQLLATGATNKVIAQNLGISPATVKNHLDAIFEKMGATNRLQAVMMANATPPQDAL
ncbi:response regulator transcription factor [Acidovorax sp.]|uniref:LuxR C-terminal-related transcriptional regulator n=1 Tax=Acidovorax sp. TaxID=1872122 RepID=UPI002617A2C2|nr:response regulator transcription factor [Acidovorax sp.]